MCPYIDEESRDELSNLFDFKSVRLDAGELNYVITRLLLATKPKCYRDYNELIGVLECCKMELARRRLFPYEDARREENGDVY